MADTWRETGRFLTPAELDGLPDDERVDYLRRSSIRDRSELQALPEPQRSTFRALLARLDGRQEGRAAS